MALEFTQFPKISRWSREVVITEKLDGTNAQVVVTENDVWAGSRTRWLTPENDNFGFAAWVYRHHEALLALGPGRHYGEWWGKKIQRGYDLDHRQFSLFNVARWTETPPPTCCNVVPILWRGMADELGRVVPEIMVELEREGSRAAPGFMAPEGIVIYHTAANTCFKKTFKKDDRRKDQ